MINYDLFRIEEFRKNIESEFLLIMEKANCELLTVHDQEISVPDFLLEKESCMELKTGKLKQTVFV